MVKKELYLKTIFCCMTCDGDIAEAEKEIVRQFCASNELFKGMDTENFLNKWIEEVNRNGEMFFRSYLNEISEMNLSGQEQMMIVDLAFRTIEADNLIEYSEVKFFKKIRKRLSVSDETILEKYPDKQDFLLPDIDMTDELVWNDDIKFTRISLR